MHVRNWLAMVLVASSLFALGCGAGGKYIKGTKVTDTDTNREILKAVERYRIAVELRDTGELMSMAHKDYWDDAGTPTGTDDYGYKGLQKVLATRFARTKSIRYSMRYMGINYARKNSEAMVDVIIDASYTLETDDGERRLDHRDQNRFVLTKQGNRWLFLSGM